MQFPDSSHPLTGISLPLSSIRTKNSIGCGEFSDLPQLAQWCAQCSLDIIQLLPVNDSGDNNSPYSALSAFALNPVYIRIQDIEELQQNKSLLNSISTSLKTHRAELNSGPVRYQHTLAYKLELLETIFSSCSDAIATSKTLKDWIAANPWIIQYAVYKVLKAENEQKAWFEWHDLQSPSPEDIQKRWQTASLQKQHFFHAWVQMLLEQQFLKAARATAELGILLKGDLPIMMSQDSADVWAHRQQFICRLRAGAPPDMFSSEGQNWGFPIYDWESMEDNSYSWWKKRLQQAEKFYHAYRIDHVLGFFRIWAIPAHNEGGSLGYFFPAAYIAQEELLHAGFPQERIRWLAEPHIPGDAIRTCLQDQTDKHVHHLFKQIGSEDLFVFSHTLPGDRYFNSLDLQNHQIDQLKKWYRDRALIEVEDDVYSPAWNWKDCSRLQQLDEREQKAFAYIVTNHANRSEAIWADHGKKLLKILCDTSNMLPCAEDLGAVPDCVQPVLADLGILGLRIPRWTRQWSLPDQPYIDIEEYSPLTVCAPSVHDTSTIQGWWQEDPTAVAQFWQSLGLAQDCPTAMTAEAAKQLYERILECASRLLIFQIQDVLLLDPELTPKQPEKDRINIPGTISDTNWSYRIPVMLDQLLENTKLSSSISRLAEKRRKRELK